jgi:hypothetical protein
MSAKPESPRGANLNLEFKKKSQKNKCVFHNDLYKVAFDELKQDHEDFRQVSEGFSTAVNHIVQSTKDTSDTLKQFRDDNREHLEMIRELHKTNTEHLQLVAGKKQVPISIFIIITMLLSGLLIATEVKYSGVDIEISLDGIKIIQNHSK